MYIKLPPLYSSLIIILEILVREATKLLFYGFRLGWCGMGDLWYLERGEKG